jgi:hypothetical protein
MFTKNGMSKVGTITVITGLALGWSTGAHAQASDRATSQSRGAAAQHQADAARQRATELARAGGWAYKTGLVERAQRDAARYQAAADESFAEAHACPPPPAPLPAQAAALSRLAELRQAGGWAYKTGAFARAEREVQSLAAPQSTSICGGREAQSRAPMTAMR